MEQPNYHKILASVGNRKKNSSLPIVENNTSPQHVAEEIVKPGSRFKFKQKKRPTDTLDALETDELGNVLTPEKEE